MAVSDIKVGTSGTCEIAPLGTTLPANASSTLDNAFVDLGEISVDGLEVAFDTSTDMIRNWAGESVRTVTSETSVQFTVAFLETTKDVVELYYGGTVASTAGDKSELVVGQPDSTPHVLAITVVDSADGSIKRYVIPRAVVTERENVVEKNDDAVKYQVTVEALYDSTIGGLAVIQFDQDLIS